MNIAGKSRKIDGSPYSRVFVAFGAAIDLTTASLNPSAATQPVGDSFRTGARHGASGLVVQVPTAGGTLTWKDAASVSSAVTFTAAQAAVPWSFPFCVTEITSFTGGAGAAVIAYWDD